jgi:hypothetical protein
LGWYALAEHVRIIFLARLMHGTLSCMVICAQLRRIDITRMTCFPDRHCTNGLASTINDHTHTHVRSARARMSYLID